MRVIFDTNLLVSMALSKGGTLEIVWRLWRTRRFEVLVSQPLVDEVKDVLERPKLAKFLSKTRRNAILSDLEQLALSTEISTPYPTFPDPDDRFLLAMIRDGAADVLVTGDKMLLELQTFEGVPIVGAAEFLGLFEDSS